MDRGIVHHEHPYWIPADECSNAPEEEYGKLGYSDHSHNSQNKTKDTETDQAQQHQPAAVCSSTHERRYGKFGYPYPQSTTDHEVNNVCTGTALSFRETKIPRLKSQLLTTISDTILYRGQYGPMYTIEVRHTLTFFISLQGICRN
jgi:hypothetical protein